MLAGNRFHLSLRSFPHKRESSLGVLSRVGTNLDARFRGHDDAFSSRDGHELLKFPNDISTRK